MDGCSNDPVAALLAALREDACPLRYGFFCDQWAKDPTIHLKGNNCASCVNLTETGQCKLDVKRIEDWFAYKREFQQAKIK